MKSLDIYFDHDSYEKYLGVFLLKIPALLKKEAIEFFKKTYSTIENCESEEEITFEIQKKQILSIFSQLNNILDEEILFAIKKDEKDRLCIRKFDELCKEAYSQLNHKDSASCDSFIKKFNDYCNSNEFKSLYEKIEKYRKKTENFENESNKTPFYE